MRTSKGLTLVELMIVVAIMSVLAAIAIPSFMRFQARAKQAEVKSNLRALFTAEKTYYAEKYRFSAMSDVGFSPEPNNRYDYWGPPVDPVALANGIVPNITQTWSRPGLPPPDGYRVITRDTMRHSVPAPAPNNTTGVFLNTILGASGTTPSITGTCPLCGFTAGATGNVDNDDRPDEWAIYSDDAVSIADSECGSDGDNAPGGTAMNNQNDVNCN